MLVIAGCQFGDELHAYTAGTPLSMVSASGSLGAYDANEKPLSPFSHVFEEPDGLRLVIRDYFYDSGPLSRPYLTVDDSGQGVVHIDTKARFAFFSTKCEFLRQFELKISSVALRGVKSLQVYNHDVNQTQSPVMLLSNPEFMSHLLQKSRQNLAVQDISNVAGGC